MTHLRLVPMLAAESDQIEAWMQNGMGIKFIRMIEDEIDCLAEEYGQMVLDLARFPNKGRHSDARGKLLRARRLREFIDTFNEYRTSKQPFNKLIYERPDV
jgi:hypothetical protein